MVSKRFANTEFQKAQWKCMWRQSTDLVKMTLNFQKSTAHPTDTPAARGNDRWIEKTHKITPIKMEAHPRRRGGRQSGRRYRVGGRSGLP